MELPLASAVEALELPGGDEGEVLVVALGFSVGVLMFFSEVAAAGFFAGEGVEAHEFAEFEEVGDAVGAFEGLVEAVAIAGHMEVAPEFGADFGDFLKGLGEGFFGAGHSTKVPHDFAEALVEGGDRLFAVNREEFSEAVSGVALGVGKGGVISGRGRVGGHGGQVVADGVRQHEVAVGKALHEGGGAEAVGPVVGEVGLARGEEAGDGGHEVVVHPEAAHGVVDGRVDAHGDFVGVFVGDLVVDVEEIAVAFLDDFFAKALDGIRKVEIDAEAGGADAAAFVANALCSA